jgi:hypothetical protein
MDWTQSFCLFALAGHQPDGRPTVGLLLCCRERRCTYLKMSHMHAGWVSRYVQKGLSLAAECCTAVAQ